MKCYTCCKSPASSVYYVACFAQIYLHEGFPRKQIQLLLLLSIVIVKYMLFFLCLLMSCLCFPSGFTAFTLRSRWQVYKVKVFSNTFHCHIYIQVSIFLCFFYSHFYSLVKMHYFFFNGGIFVVSM